MSTGWVSIVDTEKQKTIFGIPAQVTSVAYLCIGYVSEFLAIAELEKKGWQRRQNLANLIHFDRWGAQDEARSSLLALPAEERS